MKLNEFTRKLTDTNVFVQALNKVITDLKANWQQYISIKGGTPKETAQLRLNYLFKGCLKLAATKSNYGIFELNGDNLHIRVSNHKDNIVNYAYQYSKLKFDYIYDFIFNFADQEDGPIEKDWNYYDKKTNSNKVIPMKIYKFNALRLENYNNIVEFLYSLINLVQTGSYEKPAFSGNQQQANNQQTDNQQKTNSHTSEKSKYDVPQNTSVRDDKYPTVATNNGADYVSEEKQSNIKQNESKRYYKWNKPFDLNESLSLMYRICKI